MSAERKRLLNGRQSPLRVPQSANDLEGRNIAEVGLYTYLHRFIIFSLSVSGVQNCFLVFLVFRLTHSFQLFTTFVVHSTYSLFLVFWSPICFSKTCFGFFFACSNDGCRCCLVSYHMLPANGFRRSERRSEATKAPKTKLLFR